MCLRKMGILSQFLLFRVSEKPKGRKIQEKDFGNVMAKMSFRERYLCIRKKDIWSVAKRVKMVFHVEQSLCIS